MPLLVSILTSVSPSLLASWFHNRSLCRILEPLDRLALLLAHRALLRVRTLTLSLGNVRQVGASLQNCFQASVVAIVPSDLCSLNG